MTYIRYFVIGHEYRGYENQLFLSQFWLKLSAQADSVESEREEIAAMASDIQTTSKALGEPLAAKSQILETGAALTQVSRIADICYKSI